MEKRRNVVSVKFSDKELELVDEYAYETNRLRSTYIRDIVLGRTPRQRPPEAFYDVLKELRYISNNLNQLAIKAHKLNYIDELKYQQEVDTLNNLILEIKNKYLKG